MAKKKIVVKGSKKPTRKKKVVVKKAKDTNSASHKSAVKDVSGLTIFDEIFCVELLKDLVQAKAYQRAREAQGMKPVTDGTARVEACKLVQKPAVIARLEELRGRLVDRMSIDLNRVMDEYGKMAFANPSDLFDDNGNPKDFNKLSEVLGGFDIAIEQDEDGKYYVSKMQHRQAAKLQALNSLTRILGGFKDNLNLSGKVSLVGAILDEIDGDTAAFTPGE